MNQTKKPEGIYNIIFWAFVALLPFVKVDAVIDSTLVPRQLFLGVFLVVAAGLASLKGAKPKQVKFGWVQLFVLAFLLLQGLAYFFALNKAEAAATLSRYAGYVGYFTLIYALLQLNLLNKNNVAKAFVVLGVIATLLTTVALLGALGDGNFWRDVYVIKSTFGHKNILSAVLMLSLPFFLMLATTKEKVWSSLSLLFFFLNLVIIFMLRTRGVWLATFIGSASALLVYYIIVQKKAEAPKLSFKWIGIALLCSLGVGALLLTNKGVSSQVSDVSNVSRRAVFWQNSLKMLETDWATGVGPGNWKIHFPKYGLGDLDVTVQEGVTNIQRPHNDYLWVFTEGGILSILAYLGIFALSLFYLIKAIKTENASSALSKTIIFGAVVAYMVFSFGDFPLERNIPVLMLLTLIALGVFGVDETKFSVKGKASFSVPLALGAVALLIGYYRLSGEKEAMKVLQANAERNPVKLVDASLNAVNPFFNMDNYANPIPYFTGTGYAAQKKPQLAIIELETALELHPNHVLSLYTLANTHRALGEPEVALPYYQRALQIAPLNARLGVAAADLYVQQNNYFEALRVLNLVPTSHPDPRYKQLVAKSVQYFYENQAKEKRFKVLVAYLNKRQPKSAQEFFTSYVAFRAQIAK